MTRRPPAATDAEARVYRARDLTDTVQPDGASCAAPQGTQNSRIPALPGRSHSVLHPTCIHSAAPLTRMFDAVARPPQQALSPMKHADAQRHAIPGRVACCSAALRHATAGFDRVASNLSALQLRLDGTQLGRRVPPATPGRTDESARAPSAQGARRGCDRVSADLQRSIEISYTCAPRRGWHLQPQGPVHHAFTLTATDARSPA